MYVAFIGRKENKADVKNQGGKFQIRDWGMIKYSIFFLTLPSVAYAMNHGSILKKFWVTFCAQLMICACAFIAFMAIYLFLRKILQSNYLFKIRTWSVSFKVSLCCYILFFILCIIVVKNSIMTYFTILYLFLGCLVYFAYIDYRETFLRYVNYLFTLYEFIVLLIVSNDGWMHDLIDYDYNDYHVFVFLLFSFPTIAYVSSIVFEKRKTERYKP